jgi:cytochrome b561
VPSTHQEILMTDAILTRRELMPAAVANDAVAPAYTLTARILHWGTATLIFAMIPLGVVMAKGSGGRFQEAIHDLHKSVGALLIALALVRLAYRLMKAPLPLPNDIPRLQQIVAHATHWGLYALLLAQPIVGWMATSAHGASIVVFGWFELPPICPKNPEIAELLFSLHGRTGMAIAGLVAMHMGGALYHHFVRKDRVLMRMITG